MKKDNDELINEKHLYAYKSGKLKLVESSKTPNKTTGRMCLFDPHTKNEMQLQISFNDTKGRKEMAQYLEEMNIPQKDIANIVRVSPSTVSTDCNTIQPKVISERVESNNYKPKKIYHIFKSEDECLNK